MIRKYIDNMRRILRSYHNPLNNPESISKKDRLERKFYDCEAEKYLQNFNEDLFLYDENEDFPASHQYFYSLLKDIQGKRVLDLCCGHGFTSVKCAKCGEIVTGVDISPKMIELARRNADLNNVSENISLKVMSVQKMDFKNETYDYAVGIGALHHLNLDFAIHEISRVLKKNGKAIFLEPRLPYKWMLFLRSIIPVYCHESPGGWYLQDNHIKDYIKYFAESRINHFLLFAKFCRFQLLNRYARKIEKLDTYLLNKYPFIRKFSWAFVLEFKK